MKVWKLFTIGFGVIACASLLMLNSCGGSSDFSRAYLDKYVELETKTTLEAHAMKPGLSVYVDFSDGMNAAYSSQLSQDALRKVINVFTGVDQKASFFSLADSKITPLELSQTQIYNEIMSAKNYTKPMAPIEETLKTIVEKSQPALLITDFEEYNGGVIQQQNYAKDYFINWLKKGYYITFYKIDYKEGSKPKHLYFTVFDSPSNSLASTVENALMPFIGNGMERFVLAGRDYSYDIATDYPSSTKGGSYHNSNGEDIVSAVYEDGKSEAYYAYSGNFRDPEAAKNRSNFATLNTLYGPFIQYYPLGDNFENIISNISATQEEGVEPADKFTHLLSKVYVNFSVQDGFIIKSVKAQVLDFSSAMSHFIAKLEEQSEDEATIGIPADMPASKEVLDMFEANITPAKVPQLKGNGWYEILFDFDPRFKGAIPASMQDERDLLKADIVIADAVPNTEGLSEFFSWPGNNSLEQSVLNTLIDPDINPKGSVVITYFLKVI